MILPENSVIATLGPSFSFHDIALSSYKGKIQIIYCSSFGDIFQTLMDEVASHALVALRNSIHGLVANNKSFIKESDLEVIEEINLPIQLHLAAKLKYDSSDISKVIAHPVAWQECQKFVQKHHFQHISSNSNAQALEDLKSSKETAIAAISGGEAIAHYGMNIIQENIHDQEPNITTFALIQKK